MSNDGSMIENMDPSHIHLAVKKCLRNIWMAPKEIDKIKERQILEREIRKRLDFRRCNEIALDYKDKLKAKEKAEDEAWKAMIMIEAEKEAKLEQMGQQRRRMKMLELKKEADRLLVNKIFLQTHALFVTSKIEFSNSRI